MSTGLMLIKQMEQLQTNANMQTPTVVMGLADLSAVTPPSSPSTSRYECQVLNM